jgi:hypothetical protein
MVDAQRRAAAAPSEEIGRRHAPGAAIVAAD